jgi:hypothetical protein
LALKRGEFALKAKVQGQDYRFKGFEVKDLKGTTVGQPTDNGTVRTMRINAVQHGVQLEGKGFLGSPRRLFGRGLFQFTLASRDPRRVLVGKIRIRCKEE